MNLSQTPDSVRSETYEGHVRKNGVFVGFVKDNRDAQRMGRLMVYIPEFGGDPKDKNSWYIVSYASPFAGSTSIDSVQQGDKTMKGSQQSYGFWMVPPDLENEVLCCFVNGDTARGYWFACLYQQFMNHMVPGIAVNVSTRDDINKINTPPVTEYNKKNPDNVWNPKRPVFEPLHNGLIAQGLYADPERGPQTSGARREAPSKVFGFSTPRGNNIHIDDDPNNEFIRLRTRSGVQIVIHETTGYIYMISKQGNSWMEISDIGIDLYSKRSISMRAEENINIHADKNIVMYSAGAVHTTGANITTCSSGRVTTNAAGEQRRHSPRIKDNSNNDAQKNDNKKSEKEKQQDQKKQEDNKTPGAPGTGDQAAKPGETASDKPATTPNTDTAPNTETESYSPGYNLGSASEFHPIGDAGQAPVFTQDFSIGPNGGTDGNITLGSPDFATSDLMGPGNFTPNPYGDLSGSQAAFTSSSSSFSSGSVAGQPLPSNLNPRK